MISSIKLIAILFLCYDSEPLKLLKQRHCRSPSPPPIHQRAQLHAYRSQGVHDQHYEKRDGKNHQVEEIEIQDRKREDHFTFENFIRPQQRRNYHFRKEKNLNIENQKTDIDNFHTHV